ncbi:MAG: transcription antitermination factor NusB [Proteobacteria bacterium]|nr:transcription antitermination factor NusB [Pseudomonadota bacterium]MBU1736750.1 transcription antitermination factor NusB [Pseudomonadota bacterium]
MSVPIRRKARELALQVLYQSETTGLQEDAALLSVLGNFQSDKKAVSYARVLLEGISANREAIDELIQGQSENWRMERMATVDRNILRIAVYELSEKPDIPASVVINEAIEVAGRFSSEDAFSFINGILDGVMKKLGREERPGR